MITKICDIYLTRQIYFILVEIYFWNNVLKQIFETTRWEIYGARFARAGLRTLFAPWQKGKSSIFPKKHNLPIAQNRAESEACFFVKVPGNGAPKALFSLVVFSNTQDLRRCGWKRDVHFSLSKNYHSLPFQCLKRRWAPFGNVMCIKVHQRYSGRKN